MSDLRFIKYIPSEKAKWLRKEHTPLYLLLSVIVERARWHIEDSPEGLKQGDAILGESAYLEAGISRQQYRDAIEKGEKFGIFEIVWNPKIPKQQKRTINGTMKSLVVNFRKCDIWDLNFNNDNHQRNHEGTMREPSENHKQRKKRIEESKEDITTDDLMVVNGENIIPIDFKENHIYKEQKDNITYNIGTNTEEFKNKNKKTTHKYNKKETKSNKELIIKISFRDHVTLTQDEHDKLKELHKEKFEDLLDELDSYKGSNSKNYDSDYHVMKKGGWLGNKYLSHSDSKTSPSNSKKNIENFQHGKIYSGFECCIDQIGIGFQKGMYYYGLKFNEKGFNDQFENLLRKLNINQSMA